MKICLGPKQVEVDYLLYWVTGVMIKVSKKPKASKQVPNTLTHRRLGVKSKSFGWPIKTSLINKITLNKLATEK